MSWVPASEFEVELVAASGDDVRTLALLRDAEFALPLSADAAAGREPPAWPVVPGWVCAYTSVEAMISGTDGAVGHHRVVAFRELAAGWPDPFLGLAVNPGLPVQTLLESGTVARLAAPPLEVEYSAPEPAEPWPPVLQKLVPAVEVGPTLAGPRAQVSGFVHRLVDVGHIATPVVLAEALGLDPGNVLDDTGAVTLLRWPAAGFALYRNAYGGTTPEARDAVAGTLVEPPPFTGLGFGPNVDQEIREYKADGVLLPHGAELWELTDEGRTRRRAIFDGDRERWVLLVAADVGDQVRP